MFPGIVPGCKLKVVWLNVCTKGNMQNDSHIPKVKAILNNIIAKRNALGYTQEYMGYRMGMSQNAYSKIELGYTNITVNHLFLIAEILGCKADDLLKGK
jgi:DNA-binding XRE family transcriptional regulator